MNPAGVGGGAASFMGMPMAGGMGAGAAGSGAFPMMDFSQMAAAGFNPYMFGFAGQPGAAAGAGMLPQAWFPGVGMGGGGGGVSSFHAPGEKNEIKLFVGGLQFSTQGKKLLTFASILNPYLNLL